MRFFRSARRAGGLARETSALVVPRSPAEELSTEVGDDDRQFVIERRDLVLEVDGIALVRPQKYLEHVLVPQVHEVFGHGRSERAICRIHQEIETGIRV